MIKLSLRTFVDAALDAKRVTADDLAVLRRDILADGLISREEADVLVALDRAVPDLAPDWADWLTAAVVDFAVWGSRPTGRVTADTARWLAISLSGRSGPTETGMRIALEVIKEAQEVDEALLAFVMRDKAPGPQGRQDRAATPCDLAA